MLPQEVPNTCPGVHITIPTGYYTADNLCSTINNLIATLPTHSVSGETPLGISLSQDPDEYHINISLTRPSSDAGDKWFSPVNEKTSIWKLLGFVNTQVINKLKRKAKELDDIANVLPNPSSEYAYYDVVPGWFVGNTQYSQGLPSRND